MSYSVSVVVSKGLGFGVLGCPLLAVWAPGLKGMLSRHEVFKNTSLHKDMNKKTGAWMGFNFWIY